MKTVRKAHLIIIICLFLAACSPSITDPPEPPEAIEGALDFRDWDFEKDGSLNLVGEWAFFWGELLHPDQITHPIQAPYVTVPEVWTDYNIEGTTLAPEGYATYYLTLYPPDANQVYGLYLEGQGSAYTLWIDGRLAAQNGQVGTDFQSMTPEKKPLTVFFEAGGEAVEIVIQISNFHHRKAGFRNNILLNLAEPVHYYQMQNWFVEAFTVGTLSIMGIYHLFIYILRPKNKAPLVFSLMCWLSTVRVGVTNQSTLLFHLPILSWATAFRAEYMTFFLAPVLLTLFMRSLYPKDVHRWFVRVSVGLGIGFILFLGFADTMTLSYSSTYYQVVILLNVLYFTFFLARIMIKRREGAFYIGLASSVMFAAVIIETLYLQNVIDSIYLQNFLPIGQITSFSFLAFILVQAILLSARFSKSFYRVETLSSELEDVNINLRQSEKKYRNIFEESKDMIFIGGLDGQIEDVSPACDEVLGYPKEELLQMKVQDLILHPEIRSQFERAISEQGAVRNFEVELQRKDGQKIDALVTATLRHEEDGKVTGFQGSVRDITSRKQAQAERLRALKLEEIAITDPLTQIYNRRFLYEAAEKEIERAKRSGSSLAVLIFDIDHFKNINDTYGHLTGDQVLINLVNLCQHNIRSMDYLARFGGDEFIILMPDTDSRSALETAERLREMVAEKPMTTSENTEVPVTISMGISNWTYDSPLNIKALLNQADKALYQSKEAGRNRVSVWGEVLSL